MTQHPTSSKVLALLGVALAAVMLAPRCADASMHKIRITDKTGTKETLTHPDLNYSDAHGNYMGTTYDPYVEVASDGAPRKTAWIYNARIVSVALQPGKSEPRISVTLDDGQVMTGFFPDPSLSIKGQGELGDTTYEIKNIRSIEFLEFCTYPEEKEKVRERSKAVQTWQREREKSIRWTVTADGSTFPAPGLFLRDSYSTNEAGNTIYFNRSFREHNLYSAGDYAGFSSTFFNWLPVERGASSVEVGWDEVQTIEISGGVIRAKDGASKPEVRITKKGGAPQTAALPFGEGPDFDLDDTLVWQTPFGLQGASLKPVRKIVMTQEIKETRRKKQ